MRGTSGSGAEVSRSGFPRYVTCFSFVHPIADCGRPLRPGASPRSRSVIPNPLRTLLTLAALVARGSSVRVEAQSLTFGELVGSASDPASRPIVGADVRAVDQRSGAVRWLRATRDGRFRFTVLPAGRYDVTVEALGYRPVVFVGVIVSASHSASVAAVLHEATLPVTQVDTVNVVASATSAGAWLHDRGFVELGGARRVASEAFVASTAADAMGVEGLPWRLTETLVDGARSVSHGGPGGAGADAAALALPTRSASALSVGGLGFDVEVGGTGVGLVSTTRRAGRLPGSEIVVDGGTASIGASLVGGGPIEGDTTRAIVGVDFQRSEVSRPSAFGLNTAFASSVLGSAQSVYGTDLNAYTIPQFRVDQRIGAFGRLDWQPADRFAISVRASGSRFTSTGLAEPVGPLAELGDDYEAVAAQVSVSVLSRITRRITQEFRVSADISDVSSALPALAPTQFIGPGLAVGGGWSQPFDDARTTPRVSAMLHFDLGAHRIKSGFSLASHRYDAKSGAGGPGEFRFGDDTDFAAGLGAWRRVEDAVPVGQFRMSETSFFIQDRWRIADGLTATFGTRVDGMRLPAGKIEGNAAWLAATGIDNRAIDGARSEVSPRVGVRWELGSRRDWVVEGGAGVFQELPDRRDIAEALTFDRGARVREGVGALGAWPSAPDTIAAPFVGRTVTLLGPDFEGPRTQRLALGVSRRIGEWTLSVGGTYRHTSYLSRRRDLNLSVVSTGRDQYGRPLYGTLAQQGTLLAAVPQSNRRFTEFDAVYQLEATGYSDFRAASLGLERVRAEGLSLGLGYTYSQTTDNVNGFAPSRITPFVDGLAGYDWTDARSDLDVPHRAVLAGEWSAGATRAFRIGALYRLSSGRAFTPSVRAGVDANADGDAANDPAFVDPSLAGMDALLAANECLRAFTGTFAARNSCRGELSHRVDVRVAFRLANLQSGRWELLLDVLDLVSAETGRSDNALLLVDRTRSVTFNAGTGVTTVPYVTNPAFGKVLADRSPGPLWRVGLRVSP